VSAPNSYFNKGHQHAKTIISKRSTGPHGHQRLEHPFGGMGHGKTSNRSLENGQLRLLP
jgi:hypothetical protein